MEMCLNMILNAELALEVSGHMAASEDRFFYPGLSRNFANILINSKGVQCSLSQNTEIVATSKLLQVLLISHRSFSKFFELNIN